MRIAGQRFYERMIRRPRKGFRYKSCFQTCTKVPTFFSWNVAVCENTNVAPGIFWNLGDLPRSLNVVENVSCCVLRISKAKSGKCPDLIVPYIFISLCLKLCVCTKRNEISCKVVAETRVDTNFLSLERNSWKFCDKNFYTQWDNIQSQRKGANLEIGVMRLTHSSWHTDLERK